MVASAKNVIPYLKIEITPICFLKIIFTNYKLEFCYTPITEYSGVSCFSCWCNLETFKRGMIPE